QAVYRIYEFVMTINSEDCYCDKMIIDTNVENEILTFYKKHIILEHNKEETFEMISAHEQKIFQKNVAAIMEVYKKTNYLFYQDVVEILNCIHISKGKFHTTAATSLRYFGMMPLRYKVFDSSEEQFLYFYDSIAHETSHILLNLMMTFDPIVLN